MRDYLVVGFIIASFPIGIIRPFYGLMIYTWVSFMYPQMLAWSFAQTFPVAKLAFISCLAGVLLNRGVDAAPLGKREMIALIVFWCTFSISSIFAIYPADAWGQWQDESKIILMALLTAMFITDRARMRYFLLVVALSLGFYGMKGGVFTILNGGENKVFGPGTSIISANNSIGLALNMALPLLWYLARQERRYLKLLLYLMFFLSIPAIMFTYSRGSALALAAVLLVMCFRKKGLVLIPLIAVAALLIARFIPEKWWNRQETTLTYEEDVSAMSRIDVWKFSLRLAAEKPITGAGFQFQSPDMFQKYAPELWEKYGQDYNTHNAFLSILAAHGFPGLMAYLAIIGFSVLTCRRVRRSLRHRTDLKWLADWCDMVQLSFLAFCVNGMFINMEYFDLVYDLAAIAAALKIISDRELSVPEPHYAVSPSEPLSAAS